LVDACPTSTVLGDGVLEVEVVSAGGEAGCGGVFGDPAATQLFTPELPFVGWGWAG
jgi:hypothetical protein